MNQNVLKVYTRIPPPISTFTGKQFLKSLQVILIGTLLGYGPLVQVPLTSFFKLDQFGILNSLYILALPPPKKTLMGHYRLFSIFQLLDNFFLVPFHTFLRMLLPRLTPRTDDPAHSFTEITNCSHLSLLLC